MHAKLSICIIDDQDRRRAVLEDKLGNTFTVISMRTPSVLVAAWPQADLALVSAQYDNLRNVRRIAEQHQEALPIIAFGEMLDADQVVSAIFAGAIDCIDLSRHWRDLPERVELALSRHSPHFEPELHAVQSAGDVAEHDRQILGLFAAGKAEHRVARERGLRDRALESEVEQIREEPRPLSFKGVLRRLIQFR